MLSSMAPRARDLNEALADLEGALRSSAPDVVASLRAGASSAVLKKLVKVVGALPVDVETLFQWHDGQAGFSALGPSINDRMLSCAAAGAAWRSLEESANGPWKSAWLPLLENGGGDYVVIDRPSGKLHRYYHDETARPRVAPSLAAWADGVSAAWAAVRRSKSVNDELDGWKRVESPNKAAIAKKPAGTAYLYRASAASLGKGSFHHLFWKKEKNAWFQSAQLDLASCWTAISNNLLPFQATPDAGMEMCLSAKRVFCDGKKADGAGLFEKHFPAPPFAR